MRIPGISVREKSQSLNSRGTKDKEEKVFYQNGNKKTLPEDTGRVFYEPLNLFQCISKAFRRG